jgi:hypothetical protein
MEKSVFVKWVNEEIDRHGSARAFVEAIAAASPGFSMSAENARLWKNGKTTGISLETRQALARYRGWGLVQFDRWLEAGEEPESALPDLPLQDLGVSRAIAQLALIGEWCNDKVCALAVLPHAVTLAHHLAQHLTKEQNLVSLFLVREFERRGLDIANDADVTKFLGDKDSTIDRSSLIAGIRGERAIDPGDFIFLQWRIKSFLKIDMPMNTLEGLASGDGSLLLPK